MLSLSNQTSGIAESIVPILNRLLRSRFGRSLVIFAVFFVCVFLVATAAGFSGLLFALLLASCGAAADVIMLSRRIGKPGERIEDLGRSVTIIIAAGVALLIAALIFREIAHRSLQ
ncbi:MAG: hypothetical protein O3A53_08950 [Acidobacteria bacterium]|nr:hypothetical protein [Acidobacteriota bacterium]MDA1234916.1 hypothetical protein [Acidobacteriota bacterium]